MSYYQKTFSQNLSNVLTKLNLTDENIIYSVQFISNEDVQIDRDGPDSNWNITFLCIEKIENDYIFHFNFSDEFHSYSYPYFWYPGGYDGCPLRDGCVSNLPPY